MNTIEHAVAAIDAVTDAMTPKKARWRRLDALLTKMRDAIVYGDGIEDFSDEYIAAQAIRSDIEANRRMLPDGTEVTMADFTDCAIDRMTEVLVLERLAAAIAGSDDEKRAFGQWFCAWFAADVAGVVRRHVRRTLP